MAKRGIDLSAIPSYNVFAASFWNWSTIGAFLLPVLSAGSQVLTSLISQRMNDSVVTNEKGLEDKETAKNSDANQTAKTMLYMMPIMTLWIGFTIVAYDEIVRELGIDGQLLCSVAIGYPDEQPDARPRKDFDEIVEWLP